MTDAKEKKPKKKTQHKGYIAPGYVVKGLKPVPSSVLKKHSQGAMGNTEPLLTPVERVIKIEGKDFSWEKASPEDFNRSRSWCLTIFQEKTRIVQFDEKQMQYMIIGSEICPTSKKHHFQCFVYFYNPKKFVEVRNYFYKRLGKYVHFNKCNGTISQNISYCSKDEDFTEHGKPPTDKHGGGNTPLKECVDQLLNNEITTDHILRTNPDFYGQNWRVLEKAAISRLKTLKRTQRTTCDWFYGTSGAGKTRLAEFLSENNFKSFYTFNLKDYAKNSWTEDYKGEECVVINEFRGEIEYSALLELCDISRFKVNLRGIGGIPFVSKHIFITSCKRPEQVYKKRDTEDKLFQLLRRINVYKLEGEHIIRNDKRIFSITGTLVNKALSDQELEEIEFKIIDNSHLPYIEEKEITDHNLDNLFLD